MSVHQLGYGIGDRVHIFTPSGYFTGTAWKITSSGRLNVQTKRGIFQFLRSGRAVGDNARFSSSSWILPKDEQEERAKEVQESNRVQRAQDTFRKEMQRLTQMKLETQRAEIKTGLHDLWVKVNRGDL